MKERLVLVGKRVEDAQGLLGRFLDEALLHGMLGFLLFAGALHINLNDLGQQKWTIAALATVGVLLSRRSALPSTAMVHRFSSLTMAATRRLSGEKTIWCLLFQVFSKKSGLAGSLKRVLIVSRIWRVWAKRSSRAPFKCAGSGKGT